MLKPELVTQTLMLPFAHCHLHGFYDAQDVRSIQILCSYICHICDDLCPNNAYIIKQVNVFVENGETHWGRRARTAMYATRPKSVCWM